jgi:hypothetical protein
MFIAVAVAAIAAWGILQVTKEPAVLFIDSEYPNGVVYLDDRPIGTGAHLELTRSNLKTSLGHSFAHFDDQKFAIGGSSWGFKLWGVRKKDGTVPILWMKPTPAAIATIDTPYGKAMVIRHFNQDTEGPPWYGRIRFGKMIEEQLRAGEVRLIEPLESLAPNRAVIRFVGDLTTCDEVPTYVSALIYDLKRPSPEMVRTEISPEAWDRGNHYREVTIDLPHLPPGDYWISATLYPTMKFGGAPLASTEPTYFRNHFIRKGISLPDLVSKCQVATDWGRKDCTCRPRPMMARLTESAG